jgi:hypothetical protein
MDQYKQNWDRNKPIDLIFAPDDNLLKDINKSRSKSEYTLTCGAKNINKQQTGKSNVKNDSGKINSAQKQLEVKSVPHNKLSKHMG